MRWRTREKSALLRARRAQWCAALLIKLSLLPVLAIGSLALFLKDRDIILPDWIRSHVQAQLLNSDPAARQLDFGAMTLGLSGDWHPRLGLRDVTLSRADGLAVLSIADMRGMIELRSLLEGRVMPLRMDVDGAVATFQRASDGTVRLMAADQGQAVREAPSVPELVGQLDELFQQPSFLKLSEIALNGVTMRFEDLLAHRVWTIDGARMRMTRDGNDLRVAADLALLTGGADVTTVEVNYRSEVGSQFAEYGVSVNELPAQDLVAFNPSFGWLAGLRAPLSGAIRSSIEASGTPQPVHAMLQVGEGAFQPTDRTRPIPFNSAQAYFSYEPGSREVIFDALTVDSSWGRGALDGRAVMSKFEDGRLTEMLAQVRLYALVLDPPGVYPEPLRLDGAEVDLRLIPEPFRLDIGQMRVMDGTQSIFLNGHVSAEPEGWAVGIDTTAEIIDVARLMELWPASAADKARGWVARNLSGGRVHGAEFSLRTKPGTQPKTALTFGFTETDVSILETMPPIRSAIGIASLVQSRFALWLEDGQVEAPSGGTLNVTGSSFVIPDVTVQGGTPAEADIRATGPLPAMLSVLDTEPLSLLDNAGLPTNLAQGAVDAQILLRLPLKDLIPAEEILYDVAAVVTDVTSDVLVPDRRITSERLEILANRDGVRISGPGQFDGIPATAEWRQTRGADGQGATNTLVADVTVTSRALDILGIDLPDGTVRGTGRGRLTLDLAQRRASRFRFQSDLAGLTVAIPPLGWSKPAGRRGNLDVSGVLGAVPRVDRIALDASGLKATGAITLTASGGLERARFDRVQLGGWLDAPVTFTGRGANRPPAIALDGGLLDLRNAEFGGSSAGGEAGPLRLKLDRLRITDTISLTGMSGEFELAGGLRGRFTGRVNGGAAITGSVAPDKGRNAFRLRSSDAGGVFASAGLLKQARGGEMDLRLAPVGTAGAFNGSLTVANTRVQDAPAIAELFNALSIVGLLEQMGGQGLHFAEVQAAFRLTPRLITLTQASAVGPSMGLSMDGTYDLNSDVMSMRGVLSPLYIINGVGALVSRRGEGLIGFNFGLDGSASAPRVSVNPLSILTPAIFREIFRRPAPTLELEPGESPGSSPQVVGSSSVRPKRERPAGSDK